MERDHSLSFTGERFIPGIEDYKLEMEHVQRYQCAKKMVAGKIVVDAACGEGYGSNILADVAKKVIGVDLDEATVAHARIQYADKTNLEFLQGNIASLKGIPTGSVDVVISFETIEHVGQEIQKKFLKEIKRILKRDGFLVMSTPNRKVYSDMFQYHNEFHVHEFTREGFVTFLKTRFRNIRLLSQSFEVNCMISDDKDQREGIEMQYCEKNALDTCKYLIAIAGNESIPQTSLKSVFVGKYGEYNERMLRILELQKGEEERNQHIHKLDGELEEKGQYIFGLQKEVETKDTVWQNRITESHSSLDIVSKQFAEQMRSLQKDIDDSRYQCAEAQRKQAEAEERAIRAEEKVAQTEEKTAQAEEKVQTSEMECSSLRQQNLEKDGEIASLREELSENRDALTHLGEELEAQKQRSQDLEGQVENARRDCGAFEEEIQARDLELSRVNREIRECQDAFSQKLEELEAQKQHSLELEERAEKARRDCEVLQEDIQTRDTELFQKNRELEGCQAALDQTREELNKDKLRISEIETEAESARKEWLSIREELQEQIKKEIQHTQEQKEAAEAIRSEGERMLAEKQTQLTILTGHYEDTIRELRQVLRNKEGHIEQLLEKEREFERIKAQRSYRMGEWIHRVSCVLLPGGSTRRFVLGMIWKVVRHPIRMIRFFTPHRIGKFFWLYRRGGWSAVQYRFRVLEANELADPAANVPDAKYQLLETDESGERKDYAPIGFETYSYPAVSIVIPVYNQFPYTYNCLKAIQQNTSGVSYEILVADDCSTDLTQELEKIARNVKIIHNEKNLGFLLNCNHAAEQASGKYILFLNNDTQVQEGWLNALLELMEKDETIGLTGSKLVYGNGQLQEAGGIVWKDGSAWNYGNQKNPDDPEYAYVKETDYISGACIMLRKTLWEELGGFDETFAPAYYEDTDLAFRVREKGYRVVYQPASVVVHFEGISNGTDVTGGMKAWQVVNQQKFYARWKNVLERDHFKNGENVFLAKDRSRWKKQILVVDHYVPHFDKDAGGRCTFMWLKMFVKLGFKVTFIGDNYFRHEPYTTILNQMGIEVLFGNFYYLNYKEWLRENLHYFDYIYLQRPHISIKYIDIVKECARGKIFYFAHDLHFLRLQREYQLTGKDSYRLQSEDMRKTEFYLFDKADVVHVVGSYEQEYLQKLLPDKVIRNIPLYLYENIPDDIPKDFSGRKNLIFVGGFGHTPNIDGVLWFAREVFPHILEVYPDMKWIVVGGKAPQEVLDLADEHIILKGFVSDEELEALYRSCRLAVVPLRFGAGVKGKVLEAAYYQIPLVTTTIGAEGIPVQENSFAVEDDPGKMAELIIDLYGNYGKLEAMSNNGVNLIRKYYTMEKAEEIFCQDM